MKVKELISKLRKFDKELNIISADSEYGDYFVKNATEVSNIVAEKYNKRKKIYVEVQLKKAIYIA